MKCLRGFKSKNEINEKIADDVGACDKCQNWSYSNGIMTCKLLASSESDKDVRVDYEDN